MERRTRSRRLGWFKISSLVLLLVVAVGALYWLQGRDMLLSSEPPRRAAQLELPARESAMLLHLRMPFALLREAAEKAMPAEFHQASGDEGTTKYDLTVRRDGPLKVTEADGKLRVTAALVVGGSAGLSGSLASLLALDENKVDAAAEIQADLSVSLGVDWCPSIAMNLAYRWTRNPRLEIVGGWWVDVEDRIRAQVEEALRGLPQQLNALIPCESLQREALSLWQARTIPVQLPAAPPLHVGLTPRAIGLSELAVRPDNLELVLALRAQTSISSVKPSLPRTDQLPPLHLVPDNRAEGDGRLRLSIPVRAGYGMIREWLMKEFAGRDIPVETPLGPVTLRVKNIFLYPSAPAIALAVEFDADMPGVLPDTTGKVTFSARPVLSQNGTRIALSELTFVRTIDSAVWSVATILFEEQIKARLSDIAVYDLRDITQGAMAELRRRLSDPSFTAGLKVSLTRPTLRLEQVVAENDALAILGTAEAGVEAEVTKLPSP